MATDHVRYTTLDMGWNFDNSYARLPELFYSRVEPTLVYSPQLVKLNRSLAGELGLNADALQTPEGVGVFAGNRLPVGAEPLAQAYAGHQFGHFTMLGDGRAVLIGEHISPSGERVDIQLKGAGRTPYSRRGDGRAALGPMLREYIISEAMHALGIPTTRSLAVVTTGETVYREKPLQGAILTRVASSHIRVGTFQYAAVWGGREEVRILADYALQRHFPEAPDGTDRYLYLLQEVCKRQAQLVAKWMLVGFVHGVMNTDNMAISGETIDYGPCAFMDTYDPATVFSSIDTYGRYAYGKQPHIAAWNLARFAETLLPLLHRDQNEAVSLAQGEMTKLADLYHWHWLNGMRAKLGIFNEEAEDETLILELLSMMEKQKADYTNTFIALTFDKYEGSAISGAPEFADWYNRWRARLRRQPQSLEDAHQLMRNSNPAVIPRNHRVEEALAAAERGDYTVMERLMEALAHPYAHSPGQEEYQVPPEPSGCPYITFCGT